MPELVKNISKIYPDYIKIIEYGQAWEPYRGKKNKKIKKLKITDKDEKDIRNIIRARTAISDIVACNSFQYFVTLTISPDSSINRYDYDDCAKHISKWLNNNLDKYILVPEKHKDGAFHFHLLADIPKTKLTKFSSRVYNIKSFKYGYTTAVPIKSGSEARIANYIRKYITKDLVTTVGKGRRRYWASRNLKRPEVSYNVKRPAGALLVFSQANIDVYRANKK